MLESKYLLVLSAPIPLDAAISSRLYLQLRLGGKPQSGLNAQATKWLDHHLEVRVASYDGGALILVSVAVDVHVLGGMYVCVISV